MLKQLGSDQIVMLNEHFRSHPSIINFSNEEFYFKGLNLMKLNPSSHLNSKQYFKQLKVLSVANMLGEAIWRIHEESSISSMF